MTTHFTVVGPLEQVETITEGHGIRELNRLVKAHGSGNWRKRKGVAEIRLADGWTGRAEVHWYEAHGIGNASSN